MRTFLSLILLSIAFGCSPSQKESGSVDSTSVAEGDSSEVFFASEANDTTAGHMVNDEYVLENQFRYISSPFDFNLDSATVMELLGPGTLITSQYTPPGEDQYGGAYEGFYYYDVMAGDTKLSFYSYSGKHHADINTPSLPLKNGVKIGMTKTDFLIAMGKIGRA